MGLHLLYYLLVVYEIAVYTEFSVTLHFFGVSTAAKFTPILVLGQHSQIYSVTIHILIENSDSLLNLRGEIFVSIVYSEFVLRFVRVCIVPVYS